MNNTDEKLLDAVAEYWRAVRLFGVEDDKNEEVAQAAAAGAGV